MDKQQFSARSGGIGNPQLAPDHLYDSSDCTRAQIVPLLYRLLGKAPV